MAMPLHEFHPITAPEIQSVPRAPGIYLLFQLQLPLCLEQTENLRRSLVAAKQEFSRATHFAVEVHQGDQSSLVTRFEQLRSQMGSIRAAGFRGPV
jgi:hypothetical protein